MGEAVSAAAALREIRRRQGLSLRSAAAELGIAPSHLSRIERGERSVADSTAQRMSNYYSVSAEVIDLVRGQIPADVIAILREHPEELDHLRARYRG
ncbi:helix-turn-helix domain-containing protein [Microbacterium imperiale]|uniref:helix-turn-helix domain-containing protein n=1 Tax=Microbacterium imperiale TaxID=33884 RepID=UPI001AEA6D39|nr:helix-turn-helix domain-containing protein [Microbacterium imperiale]